MSKVAAFIGLLIAVDHLVLDGELVLKQLRRLAA